MLWCEQFDENVVGNDCIDVEHVEKSTHFHVS